MFFESFMVSYDKNNKFTLSRETMVRSQLTSRDITDPAVLEVMRQIPRHEFVSENYLPESYADHPLPIGLGQTISQPYIVALMTQELKLTSQSSVLEIGTGSGYQTAILAKLAKKVYTIEKHNQLSESAQTILARLGIDNVQYYIGDGSCGWPENMEFDRIIVTAAMPQVPETLKNQLCETGLLLAPVGQEFSQDLIVYEKKKNKLQSKTICACRFVKLIGKHGFNESQ